MYNLLGAAMAQNPMLQMAMRAPGLQLMSGMGRPGMPGGGAPGLPGGMGAVPGMGVPMQDGSPQMPQLPTSPGAGLAIPRGMPAPPQQQQQGGGMPAQQGISQQAMMLANMMKERQGASSMVPGNAGREGDYNIMPVDQNTMGAPGRGPMSPDGSGGMPMPPQMPPGWAEMAKQFPSSQGQMPWWMMLGGGMAPT